MPDLKHDDPLRAFSDALLGQVLPGSQGHKYPLQQLIGEGGQGWVFRATWNGSIEVVVKVLRPDAASKESLARFQREAQVLRMLAQQPFPNPHIVRFFDHAYARVHVAATGKSWELPFTVLELVEGETLDRALEKARPSGLGLDRARRILRHVVLALEDVHARNVVHRDLKPSNILLSLQGGREIAKVTDFGLAKLLDPGMAQTAKLAGATVGYAPPEQFEDGNRRVGRQTDVFSLAAIFYELVTGKPAFPFPPMAHPLLVVARILSEARPAFGRVLAAVPPELAERPDVVAEVDVELARALSPEPEQRHATVTELLAAIEKALSPLVSTPSVTESRPNAGIVVRAVDPPGEDDVIPKNTP
jgi:serine/threonine protein kinase